MWGSKAGTAVAALLVAAPLALAACGDDAESGSGDTLQLWHYEPPDSAMAVAWAEAIRVFEQEHDGVTVEFEERGFEQIQDTAQMVLNSDEAPDIMEYNKGNATAGLLSSQGLLTDLTEQATSRGWDTLISSSLQTTAKYNEQGIMGSGDWYGVPNYGEFVMVFYNQDMFAEHEVDVPTTLAEFETVMDTFVEAGITPLSVGGSEYPAQQIFYELVLSQADRSFVNAFQLYEGDVDFHGPQFTFGAQTFADWVSQGYISGDSAGIGAEDMGIAFTQGEYPMVITGTWWFGRFIEEISDFEWGTFLFPGNALHPGSSGNLWVVPERSENKELAYDFIDITMRPEIQNLLGNSGGVPVAADAAQITDEKSAELTSLFNSVLESDGLAFYPDWPAPGYYDTLVAGVQELINETKSPEEMLDDIAGPYEDNLASIGN